jgi:phosphotransferase system enzyme I (PtsI)
MNTPYINFELRGIPASSGIAIGKAVVLLPENIVIDTSKISKDDIVSEQKRFENACESLSKEMENLISAVHTDSKNVIDILESNVLILSDPVLKEGIYKRIEGLTTAENAIVQEFDEQKKLFLHTKDEYLRLRADELEHIKKRLIYVLRHKFINYRINENSIVVAQNLTPADIVNFNNTGVNGIITESGGIVSHVSIMARAYKIPSVIGFKNITSVINDGDELIIDGFSGSLIINPDKAAIADYHKKQVQIAEYHKKLGKLKDVECKTLDGVLIKIYVNIDLREDAIAGEIAGADGVGLVRSESLIMKSGGMPDLEMQEQWYKDLVNITFPKPLTIRGFDIGSDKFSEGLPHQEDNPALGCRGIRFLLLRKDIFRTQIIAVLKASVNKNVKFMLPMISNLQEVLEAKSIIAECKAELDAQGIGYDKNMPLGIMVETPAAALIADCLAKEVDFMSIGTNDLTSYTIGADRANDLVSDIFNPLHPAVFRLIKMTVKAAQKYHIPLSICGELAAYPEAIQLLIGFGIQELSMSPAMVLEAKNIVINTNKRESMIFANEMLCVTDNIEFLRRLKG